ncbi:hypothetical protein FACS189492_1500 [Clostridia bacterium]|nr:hypothetical protein FACS189492_1500 [Clostridia bacterium]
MARQLLAAFSETFPAAFANAYVTATAGSLGVRETRMITGDYVLTLDDYIERRSFDDEICRNCYFIDVHASGRTGVLFNAEQRERLKLIYEPGESHGIPYRCLTPKGLTNVLVAGRSISCERMVQGSVRVMPVCLAMGEAAGIAAAMAAANDGDVHAVSTATLRKRLVDHGALY